MTMMLHRQFQVIKTFRDDINEVCKIEKHTGGQGIE